jgi:hypothetical protein
MGAILGYARVSTGDQDVAGQTMRLTQVGAIKVFTDVRSGKTKRREPRCALMRAEQHGSVPRCGQLAVLTACRARGARFAVAQDARRDDPGLATIRNPGNVGYIFWIRTLV